MKRFVIPLAILLAFRYSAPTPIRSNFARVDVTTEEGLRVRAEANADGTLKGICVYVGMSARSFMPVESMGGWWPRLDDLSVWDVQANKFSISFPLLGPGTSLDPNDTRLVEKIGRIDYENGRFSLVTTTSKIGVTLSREPLPASATTNSCVLDK